MSWKATAFVKELRRNITVTEKFVLLILAEYHRTDDKLTWPSVSTLAADCLITERGILQILAKLEEKQFIVREKGGGRGNRTSYQIVGVDLQIPARNPEKQSLNVDSVKDINTDKTLNVGARNPAQPCSRNKEEQVLTGNGYLATETSDEIHPLNAARRMTEILGLSDRILRSVEAGIVAEMNFSGMAVEEAAQHIANCAMRDRKRGIVIDRFYFDGTVWRNANGSAQPKPSAAAVRSERSKQNILDGFAANARRADALDQPKCEIGAGKRAGSGV